MRMTVASRSSRQSKMRKNAVEIVGLDQLRLGALAAVVGQYIVECGPVLIGVLGVGREVVDANCLGHDADFLLGEAKRLADLVVSGGTSHPFGQDRRGPPPLRKQAHHVSRQPDRFPVVHHRPANRLLDPVARVCAETRIHHAVKSLDSPHQPQIPLFDQIL